jgi:hypothetical protein
LATSYNFPYIIEAILDVGGMMSYRLVKGRYEVRWLDSSGRHRAKRFRDEDAARE